MRATPFAGAAVATVGAVPPGTCAAVLGVGHSLGSPHDGAENGPYFLRTVSREYSWGADSPVVVDIRGGPPPLDGVVDLGDLDVTGRGLVEVGADLESLIDALPDEVVPAVIGGDHTVTAPVVTALRRRRPDPFTVVQFDHHLDLQVWSGAPGRPDSGRDPLFHTNVMSHVADVLGDGRLVQVGVFPYVVVDGSSAAAMPGYLRGLGHQFAVTDPRIDDPAQVAAAVPVGDDVYVTVDLDVLDPSAMTSTGYPASVGMSLAQVLRTIDAVLADHRMIGFDVVEFCADRADRDRRTLADAQRAALVVLHLLGWVGRQRAAGVGTPPVTL